ncbi:MAG: imidazolonepropionase, partial [Gammaproteobacteria bacterium]
MQPTTRLLANARVATMASVRSSPADPYGLIDDAGIVMRGGEIAWVGPRRGLPAEYIGVEATLDLGGRVVTPGLVDCHTHLIFGGNRAGEFEQRLNGASYAEIARAGGGILSTVRATRAASLEELVNGAKPRVERLLRDGVTTVEIKSGYGLDTANEVKMLEAARALGGQCAADVVTSFLGAHALPPEFGEDRDGYIALVCEQMLPEVVRLGLADAVDGFTESIGFTVDEMRRVFEAAARLDLPVKLHAEQLSDLGGAAMAAGVGALSADHLEYLSEADVEVMAKAGTVAVLLPGAFYYLSETRKPPVAALQDAG